MNWDAVGAVGEIIGAIAVLISIIYLAVQIRSNTSAMKATAGFQAAHSWAEFNNFRNVPDEQMETMFRSYDLNESWDDFTLLERGRIGSEMRSLMERLEGQYYLHKYGTLDDGLWQNRSSWAAGLIQLPVYQKWWKIEKSLLMYSDEFVKAIETAKPINVSIDVFQGSTLK